MNDRFIYKNVVKREHDWYIKGSVRTKEYDFMFEVAVDKQFNLEKVYGITRWGKFLPRLEGERIPREKWYPLIKKMIQEDIKKERIRLLTGGNEHGIT